MLISLEVTFVIFLSKSSASDVTTSISSVVSFEPSTAMASKILLFVGVSSS